MISDPQSATWKLTAININHSECQSRQAVWRLISEVKAQTSQCPHHEIEQSRNTRNLLADFSWSAVTTTFIFKVPATLGDPRPFHRLFRDVFTVTSEKWMTQQILFKVWAGQGCVERQLYWKASVPIAGVTTLLEELPHGSWVKQRVTTTQPSGETHLLSSPWVIWYYLRCWSIVHFSSQ